ncbi:MAG: GNAT family N-acetyltransferase, partial [Novosphingobium sp.]
MTGLILRPATEADIPALSALGRDSFVAKFGHMYRPEDLAAFLEQVHSLAGVASDMADPGQIFRLA